MIFNPKAPKLFLFLLAFASAVASQTQKPRIVVQTAHEAAFVHFIRDGKSLVSAGGNTLVVWDVRTGRQLRTQTIIDASSVAISPDGNTFATKGPNDSVEIYEIATGKLINSLTDAAVRVNGASFGIGALAFSPNGQQLAITSYSHIRIWDLKTRSSVRSLDYDDEFSAPMIKVIAFSSDGRWLASGSGNIRDGRRKVTLWNLATGKPAWTVDGHDRDVNSIAFSPAADLLATASDDTTIKLWNVRTGSPAGTLRGHQSEVRTIAFSANGKYLVSGSGSSSEGTVKLWDVATKKELRTFGKNDGIAGLYVSGVDFAPNGETFVVAANDIEIWQLARRQISSRLDGKSTLLYSASFDPHGERLAIAYGGWLTAVWDFTKTQGPVPLREDPNTFLLPTDFSSGIRFPAFSPDGKFLADGNGENAIKLWPSVEGVQPRTLTGHTQSVWSEAFSPDGSLLASGSYDKTVRLWDVASGQQMKILDGHKAPVNIVAFNPDGKLLASAGDDGLIKLWNVGDGTETRTLSGHQGSVRFMAFAPKERKLASIATDATIRVWNIDSGEQTASLSYSTNSFGDIGSGFGMFADAVRTVAFSPDGKILAAGYGSPLIGLWDTASGKPRGVLEGHTGSVGSVAFSPNGKLLVSTAADRQIKIWDVAAQKELCSLIVLDPYVGDWVVVTPDGRFDTNNIDRAESLHWVLPQDPFRPLPLEIFMRDYYEPRLLSKLIAGEPLSPIRDLFALNRAQPEVSITAITPRPGNDNLVDVTVEVADRTSDTQHNERGEPLHSGVYDVRLFRQGQLVGHKPVGDGRVELMAGTAVVKFPVRLPQNLSCFNNPDPQQCRDGRLRIEFSAYAFNSDRVKSETARRLFEPPVRPLVISPSGSDWKRARAYIISIGVNAYENSDWNLKYAANDAREIQRTLTEKLSQTGEFAEVVPISLISDYELKDGQPLVKEKSATKSNIKAVLDLLAGRSVDAAILKMIPNADKLRVAAPDDLVIITFSSHGYADAKGNFFFIPYDAGAGKKREITAELLQHCISSEELSMWLRDVDAGELVMIVDACHSAASVEGEGFKPGPMGSRGLGQLSYDKGMRIITSTQSDDVAVGSEVTQQGLLSYALTHDGINARLADFKPKDGTITLAEWLEYGVDDVPKLYAKISQSYDSAGVNELRDVVGGQNGGTKFIVYSRDGNNSFKKGGSQQPSLFDFTRKRKDVMLVRPN